MNFSFKSIDSLSDNDIQSIILLDKLEFDFPWSKTTWLDFLHKNQGNFKLDGLFVAKKLIGFSLLHTIVTSDQCHLLKILVSNEYRNLSLGEKLMEFSLSTLNVEQKNQSHYLSCYAEVSVSNLVAIKFYKKHGFKIINTIKSFYSDNSDAYAILKIFNEQK